MYSVTPDQGGTSGTVTVTAFGAAFPTGSTIELIAGGATILPVAVNQVDSTQILATFNLSAAPAGLADVVVFDSGGGSQTLPGAFLVMQGGGTGEFWFKIDAPAKVRAGVQNTVTLTWATGQRGRAHGVDRDPRARRSDADDHSGRPASCDATAAVDDDAQLGRGGPSAGL